MVWPEKPITLVDGVEFFHSEEKATNLERAFAKFAAWVRDNPRQYTNGFHHMGLHWTEIYSVLPKTLYKIGVLRVAHRKLGPKNITCIRKERLPGGKIRWVKSYHWEGHCPGCQKPSLKTPEPAKLIRSNRMDNSSEEKVKLIRANRTAESAQSEGKELHGRPKLLLRNSGRPKLILRKKEIDHESD